MPETRKLAAILAADVAGYSRLAGADEERTLARLRGLWSDLIDPAVAAHHGRVVKRMGDGVLIEFRSVVEFGPLRHRRAPVSRCAAARLPAHLQTDVGDHLPVGAAHDEVGQGGGRRFQFMCSGAAGLSPARIGDPRAIAEHCCDGGASTTPLLLRHSN